MTKKAEKNKIDEAKRMMEKLYQTDELPEKLRQDYKMMSCLRFGESRQVYLLEQKDTKHKLILKCESGKNADILKGEYKTLKDINESFAPKVYMCFSEENRTYLLREYIDGETIEQHIERQGTYDKKEALLVMLEICRIVEKLHKHSPAIIHRDIKPQNVVITKDGNYKFIDWETAREYKTGEEWDTVFMGTRITAAPEQFGYQQTSARTDIYSLGILFLYLLTGNVKSEGKAWNSLPSEIRRTIKKCISFAPKDRYSDMGALIRELKALLKFSCRVKTLWLWAVTITVVCSVVASVCFLPVRQPKENTDAVKFENPQLEQAVRLSLGKSEHEEISASELQGVTTLILCDDQVFSSWEAHEQYHGNYWFEFDGRNKRESTVDLDDLKHMPNINTLVLDNQGLTDLSCLAGLPIERLSLIKNNITDIAPIADNPSLEILDISYNPLENIDALEQADNLREVNFNETAIHNIDALNKEKINSLNICYTQLEDLSEVTQFKNLEKLYVSGADRSEIEMINTMKNLQLLGLFDSDIKKLSEVSGLSNLYCLDVGSSKQLEDLSGLEHFPKLSYLGIAGTRVTDLSIISKTGQLEMLDIVGTPVTELAPALTSKKLKVLFIDSGKEEYVNSLETDIEIIVVE
ncbi:MAG: protein kinase [Clostridium sp.]|nr:protein kinase [Clostridium sp.]